MTIDFLLIKIKKDNSKELKMKILVTGSAGFIGFHLSNKLAELGYDVFGIDNINDYYDVNLKLARLEKSGFDRKLIKEGKKVISKRNSNFQFVKQDLLNKTYIEELFKEERFDTVCNLSAQAGVRYSLEKPDEYLKSNIDCFLNILEFCRHNKVKNLVYDSSSSLYGLNENLPFP